MFTHYIALALIFAFHVVDITFASPRSVQDNITTALGSIRNRLFNREASRLVGGLGCPEDQKRMVMLAWLGKSYLTATTKVNGD